MRVLHGALLFGLVACHPSPNSASSTSASSSSLSATSTSGTSGTGSGSGGSTGGSSSGGVPDAGTASFSVPLTVTQTDTDGTMRYSIEIQIGDAGPLPVFFDTGSSGLRILQGAVPDSTFATITTTSTSYGYHNGLELSGVEATAFVTIGGTTTPAPIPVMLVTGVSCSSANPDCDAEGQTPATYVFFGTAKVIMGTGMRTENAIGNPIAQLPGRPAFIVESPDYGGDAGLLVIGPTPDEEAGFATYSLPPYSGGVTFFNGVGAWDDRYGLPACVDDVTTGASYCAGAEMDTGNPEIYVEWPDAGAEVHLPSGSQVQVSIGVDGGLASYSFAETPNHEVEEVDVESSEGGEPFMNLGTSIFFQQDVLLDQAHGVVGFRPHL